MEIINLKEEDSKIRRLISSLSFIRADLNSIEKLNIETPEIKHVISEIKEKVELLFDNLIKRKH